MDARVKAVLDGMDGVPDPAPAEARAILDAERAQVLHTIQTYRIRHRLATVLKNVESARNIEGALGLSLVALDAIDAELSKLTT
jgi:hypothetical protein